MKVRAVTLAAVWLLASGCPQPPETPPDGGGPVPPGPVPDFDGGGPNVDPPDFGAATINANPPPPVSGGTLAIADNDIAVAADPDRDQVYVARLDTRVVQTVALQPGDEPGRVAIVHGTVAYVALRRGGALARIDLSNLALTHIAVCPAPRGLAWDGSQVYVACVDGDVWVLADGSNAPQRFAHIDAADLRDIVVQDGYVYVSRFRSTEVVMLHPDGQVFHSIGPSQFVPRFGGRFLGQTFQPAVAWRMIGNPNGGVIMVHERGLVGSADGTGDGVVSTSQGGYGSATEPTSCGQSIVHSTVSVLRADDTVGPGPEIARGVLPVDVALDPVSGDVAVALAGNAMIRDAPRTARFSPSAMRDGVPGCVAPLPDGVVGQATAVAFTSDDRLVTQTREPASLWIDNDGPRLEIPLSHESRRDTGHDIFHSNSGGNLACASCHPEGGDDGRVWVFDSEGMRRTQNLRGGILATAPFHWAGDQPNFAHLTSDVFVGRMSGIPLDTAQVDALSRWVNAIPTLPQTPPTDPAAVARGHALFDSPAVGCSGCHSGPMFTNNLTVDVGTGAALQVPSLVGVRFRAPYLHDGRAATLRDRFDPRYGASDSHGHTSQLTADELTDLTTYLQTL